MGFAANVGNWLRFDKIREFKGQNFFETHCIHVLLNKGCGPLQLLCGRSGPRERLRPTATVQQICRLKFFNAVNFVFT